MADNKQDQNKQDAPRPSDVKVFGAGVDSQRKADADDAASRKAVARPDGADEPTDEIPGGAYIVDGQAVDANGKPLEGFGVEKNAIVKKAGAKKADENA